MMDNIMIMRLEEVTMNAWPASQTMFFDGWVLRFADGVFNRAHCIGPLYFSTEPVEAKIAFCERVYHSIQLPTVFKISERMFPDDLDAVLERRGYSIQYRISVQTLELTSVDVADSPSVQLQEAVDDAWLDQFVHCYESDPARKPAYRRILQRIIPTKCLARLVVEDRVVGCGVAVLEKPFIGLFDIAVDRAFRNQGLGQVLIDHILAWGKGHGAKIAYLQVSTQNPAALRLYEKRGFQEMYQYWYRRNALEDNGRSK